MLIILLCLLLLFVLSPVRVEFACVKVLARYRLRLEAMAVRWGHPRQNEQRGYCQAPASSRRGARHGRRREPKLVVPAARRIMLLLLCVPSVSYCVVLAAILS